MSNNKKIYDTSITIHLYTYADNKKQVRSYINNLIKSDTKLSKYYRPTIQSIGERSINTEDERDKDIVRIAHVICEDDDNEHKIKPYHSNDCIIPDDIHKVLLYSEDKDREEDNNQSPK